MLDENEMHEDHWFQRLVSVSGVMHVLSDTDTYLCWICRCLARQWLMYQDATTYSAHRWTENQCNCRSTGFVLTNINDMVTTPNLMRPAARQW